MFIRTLQLIKMTIICIGVFSYSNVMSSGISLFGFFDLIIFSKPRIKE